MKILNIGSDGRAHAIACSLKESPLEITIYSAPGNGGTAKIGENIPFEIDDVPGLIKFSVNEGIDLIIPGSETTLALGLVDESQKAGLRAFGPTKFAAQFETSKVFGKEFMEKYKIPTPPARWTSIRMQALIWVKELLREKGVAVLKADGLALGKGVRVVYTFTQAEKFLEEIMNERIFGTAGKMVLVEEFEPGEELSIQAFVDGKNYLLLPPARDYKKSHDGNKGKNTGGMGAVCSGTLASDVLMKRIRTEIMDRFMEGLASEGIEYQGIIFPGIILPPSGPKVLEFNCRFGNPEAQVVLPRLKEPPLIDIIEATLKQRLSEIKPEFRNEACVSVVVVQKPYPRKSKIIHRPIIIKDLPQDVEVIHAGTKCILSDPPNIGHDLVTNGGRVAELRARGETIAMAREKVYQNIDKISFKDSRHRKDIAKGL